MVWPQRVELLKNRVEHMLPAFLDGDLSFISTFLATYKAFATTKEVLDQLLTRWATCPSTAQWHLPASCLGVWGMPPNFLEPQLAPLTGAELLQGLGGVM